MTRQVTIVDLYDQQVNRVDYSPAHEERDPYPIVSVSITLDSFAVAGDKTSKFPAGFKFNVRGSTGNDGEWTVSSSTFDGENTVVSVTGNVTDTTADGKIFYTGVLNSAFTIVG